MRRGSLMVWVAVLGVANVGCRLTANNGHPEAGGGTGSGRDAGQEAPKIGCGATAVAAGESHACARMSDGAIWCWGEGEDGQLGNGDWLSSPYPVEVKGTGYASVSAGLRTTCASTEDEWVACWGNNDFGVLGEAPEWAGDSTPMRNYGLRTYVAAVSVASHHACALAKDGGVWCWGKNSNGQLGDGTRITSSYAVSVVGLDHVVQLSVGWEHTCAVKDDGSLWCWGDNSQSALGVPVVPSSAIPVQVASLGSDVAQVETGCGNTCAVKTDGTLWCWGNNGNFALGIASGLPALDAGDVSDDGGVDLYAGGANATIALPTEVAGLEAKAVEVGLGCGSTCVRLTDGTARCWGLDVTTGEVWRTPTEVPSLGGSLAQISVGVYLACAVKTDGGVRCWSFSSPAKDMSLCP